MVNILLLKKIIVGVRLVSRQLSAPERGPTLQMGIHAPAVVERDVMRGVNGRRHLGGSDR